MARKYLPNDLKSLDYEGRQKLLLTKSFVFCNGHEALLMEAFSRL